MRYKIQTLAILMGLTAFGIPQAYAVDYVASPPLAQVVKSSVKACGQFSQVPMPMLAWGADQATIFANGSVVTTGADGKSFSTTAPGSIFAQEGLSVRLYREDSSPQQLEDFLSCKTPFLRMTAGMAAQAGDVLARLGVYELYKLSDSEGGDVLMGRDKIKDIKDIKKVALQVYSPHVQFAAIEFKSAGVNLADVQFVWVKDITETGTNSQFPAKALLDDKTVDAAFVISPDVAALMAGKGENAVKGSHEVISTKACTTCIPDLYYVRKDWADANPQLAHKFVHALMRANESTAKLFVEKATQKEAFDKLMKASAKLLLDDASLTANAEGMWGDLRMAGFRGNVKFFTDDAHPRNHTRIMQEASEAMMSLKFITKPAAFAAYPLDYAKLKEGLADTEGVDVSRWNKAAVSELMKARKQAGTEDEGQKFILEIPFKRESSVIDLDLYRNDFDKIIDLAAIHEGLLFTVTGHVDPQQYLKVKYSGEATPKRLADTRQVAINISGRRALALRDALIKYALDKGVKLDVNQFEIIAAGFMKSNKPGCRIENGDITITCAAESPVEMQSMRRAEFRAIEVTAEMEKFEAIVVKK